MFIGTENTIFTDDGRRHQDHNPSAQFKYNKLRVKIIKKKSTASVTVTTSTDDDFLISSSSFVFNKIIINWYTISDPVRR